VGLSAEHLQHLLENRMLTPAYVEGRFATAGAARVQAALAELITQGHTEAELKAAGLVDAEGRPHSYLVEDGILIAYLDEDGQPIHLRAHKLGPPGAQLEVYGRECLADNPEEVVLTEGEYKAAALLCRDVPALAVPGISSFAGRRYEDLLGLLRGAGVQAVTICFDNEDKTSEVLPSGKENERYKPDRFNRYDTDFYAVVLARRLTGDGITTTVASLPDEWRDETGKADIDGVLRDGRPLEEVKKVLDDGLAHEVFLASLTAEAQEVIRHKLCEDRPRWTSKGLCLRKGALEITAARNPRSKKMVVTVSTNYRQVFTDEVSLASHKARIMPIPAMSIRYSA